MFGVTDDLIEYREDLMTALGLLRKAAVKPGESDSSEWNKEVLKLLLKYEPLRNPARWQEITPGAHVLLRDNEVIAFLQQGFGDSCVFWVKDGPDNDYLLHGDVPSVRAQIEQMLP